MNLRPWFPVVLLLLSGLAFASPGQDLFDEVVRLLGSNYGGFSQIKADQLAQKYQPQLTQACNSDVNCLVETAAPIVRSMLSELGDRHTRYMTPTEYADFQRRSRGATSERPQLGVQLQVVEGLPGVLVIEVSAGGPAEEAGVRRGDRILAIDGTALPEVGNERVPALREKVGEGRPLVFKVQRVQEQLEIQIRPRPVNLQQLPTVSLRSDGVALLRIPSFLGYRVVGPKVHELVQQAQQRGAKAIVVDLRNNGGGLLSECVVGAGAFVDQVFRRLRQPNQFSDQVFQNNAYSVGYGSGLNEIFKLPDAARWRGPAIVLVNEYTASCAEYFAFDMQDGKYQVIGTRTAGVGNTATIILRLRDGSGLQITTSQTQRRDGSFYPDQVTPDIDLNDDWKALAEGRDVMLERAVALVLENANR